MQLLTLKALLLKHIRKGKKTRAYLRKLGGSTATKRAEGGSDSASVDRALRKLTELKMIEPVYKKGYIISYLIK